MRGIIISTSKSNKSLALCSESFASFDFGVFAFLCRCSYTYGRQSESKQVLVACVAMVLPASGSVKRKHVWSARLRNARAVPVLIELERKHLQLHLIFAMFHWRRVLIYISFFYSLHSVRASAFTSCPRCCRLRATHTRAQYSNVNETETVGVKEAAVGEWNASSCSLNELVGQFSVNIRCSRDSYKAVMFGLQLKIAWIVIGCSCRFFFF